MKKSYRNKLICILLSPAICLVILRYMGCTWFQSLVPAMILIAVFVIGLFFAIVINCIERVEVPEPTIHKGNNIPSLTIDKPFYMQFIDKWIKKNEIKG